MRPRAPCRQARPAAGRLPTQQHPPPLTCSATRAERPPGSPTPASAAAAARHGWGGSGHAPPFGSCGNLAALTCGSIPHHVPAGGLPGLPGGSRRTSLQGSRRSDSSTGSSGGSETGLSASRSVCIGALGTARQAGAEAAGGPAAAAGGAPHQLQLLLPACGNGGGVPHPGRQPAAGGAGSAAAPVATSFARGSTVCVAAVVRSQTTREGESEVGLRTAARRARRARQHVLSVRAHTPRPSTRRQDSDDELLVPLEAVLLPHPEDLMDAPEVRRARRCCLQAAQAAPLFFRTQGPDGRPRAAPAPTHARSCRTPAALHC